MTSTEPMTNKPGKELDKRIATLFGWDTYELGGRIRARRSFGDSRAFDFDASTTWEGMRLVVEEMQRRGYQPTMNTTSERSAAVINGDVPIGYWHVSFWKGVGDVQRGFADTAPHACALACIAAIEGQET